MSPSNLSKGKVVRLKKALTKFVNEVSNTFNSGQEVDQKVVDRLEKNYKALFNLYLDIDEELVNKEFAPRTIKMINFLSLGKGQLRKMYQEVASHFSEDANKTAVAVAHFVKSRRAYDLVHKSSRTAKETQELAVMFGSLLGVKVTSNFVLSMRTEELGRVIGYALSGLCEDDMKAWNDKKTGKSLRKEFGSLDQYLLAKIRESDKWASFRFESKEGEDFFRTAFKINEHEGASDRARGRNLADHCFVRHNPNAQPGQPKGVITLGTSTAVILAQEHGFSFAKAVMAAEAMVKEKTINGEPNPYYGYEIQTFCFFAGHSPTTTLEGEIERNEIVKLLESKRSPSQPGLTDRQVMELGWLPFMSLFASTNPSPLLWRGLNHSNPMISGCDTEDLYNIQTIDHRQKKEYSTSRRLPKAVLAYTARQATLLAQDNVELDLSANGPQKALQPMLEFILYSAKNHFKNFPVMENQSISKDEEKHLNQIGTAFRKIYKKLGGRLNRQDLAGEFRDQAVFLTNPDHLRDRMEDDSIMCAQLDKPAKFDEESYNTIDALKHYDSGDRLEAVAHALASKIRSGNARALFSSAFDEVEAILSAQDEPEVSGESLDFWNAYKDCLVHALNDGLNADWMGGPSDDWDWTVLKSKRSKFLKEMKGSAAEKFVRKTIPLIGQKGPVGGSALSERIDHPTMAMELRNISKSMVAVARGAVSDSLAAEIRKMGEMSAPKRNASKKR